MGTPGRPKGSNGRKTVAIQIRVPERTAAILHAIGKDRKDCQYGGHPSPAKVVVWLCDEYEKRETIDP